MIEKVNPSHPDKIADRIAGAIVDLAYSIKDDPKVAVEVLIGHGVCHVIAESSVDFYKWDIIDIIHRIADKDVMSDIVVVPQDEHLAANQEIGIRCGDNGIFRGVPLTVEQRQLSIIARQIYDRYPYDGKYILNGGKLTICQSNAEVHDLRQIVSAIPNFMTRPLDAYINPLGEWSGGTDVDTGATNRKLGSDMADSVTGGGLHGKDLSKADVSVNIYAFLKAQMENRPVEICCSIGDDTVDGKPYSTIVELARTYIKSVGGFEKFAEWGLY